MLIMDSKFTNEDLKKHDIWKLTEYYESKLKFVNQKTLNSVAAH